MTPASGSHVANSRVSELILSDRLIALAQDADRAGYTATAERLIDLACSVFDEATRREN
jgi:hypothetical protein